jgi:hypothetical protein
MIARWVAALAIAATLAGSAQAQGERPRHVQTFPGYLYLLPPPVTYPLAAGEPAIR